MAAETLDAVSLGFGVAIGAIVMVILLAVSDRFDRQKVGDNWQGVIGVTIAGIAPVLGIIAAIVAALLGAR